MDVEMDVELDVELDASTLSVLRFRSFIVRFVQVDVKLFYVNGEYKS